MKIIKCLIKLIDEELSDAEKYADLFLKYEDDDKELSGMFQNLARQELQHMQMEHDQVTRLIRNYQASGKEAPAAMKEIWSWEHEKMVEREREIRITLSK